MILLIKALLCYESEWSPWGRLSIENRFPLYPYRTDEPYSSSPKEISVTKYFPQFDSSVFFIFSWQVRTFGDKKKKIDCQSFCLDKRFLGQARLWNFLLLNLRVSKGNFSLTKWVSFPWNAILSSSNIVIRKMYSIIHWDFVSRLTPQSCGLPSSDFMLRFGPQWDSVAGWAQWGD